MAQIPYEKSLDFTNPAISKQWHPTKNGTLTARDVTPGSGKKIWWLCDKCGHEWQAAIYSRVNGADCPVEKGKAIRIGYNDLATLRPDLEKEWHPTKNGDLTARDVTIGSKKKVWWKCAICGHEWQATINTRTSNGSDCPVEAGKIVKKGYNDLATTHPELVKEWNFEKNIHISPYEVTHGSEKIVWWKCKERGHEWQAKICNRTRKAGTQCPICPPSSVSITSMPLLVKEWHPTKNHPLTPEMANSKSHYVIWWKCEKHGHEWLDTVRSRSNGHNCPYCNEKAAIKGKTDLQTKAPGLASEWHPNKNGELLPETTLVNSRKLIWWKCKICGHEWQMSPNLRISTDILYQRCPTCFEKLKREEIIEINDFF